MRMMRYLFTGLIFIYGGLLTVREAEAMPITPDKAIHQLVEGNNSFALALYSQLKHIDGNLFFSPYSLSSALSMTYGGARGETAHEMADALGFDLPCDLLHPAFAELNERLMSKKQLTLSLANSLWLQKGTELLEEYLDLTSEYYDAAVMLTDFMIDPDESCRRINKWVVEQTQEKIHNIITPGNINALTRLILTNAIYFKGNWEKEFNKNQTREENFYVQQDRHVKAAFMRQQGNFKYGESEDAQVLQVPYDGGSLGMLLVLPKTQDGLAALESGLTMERMKRWQQALAMREVKIAIPRFRAKTAVELSESLKALGMNQAFTNTANFSGIDGTEELSLSSVLHEAFIDVTEEGAEAAAATAVIIGVTAVRDPAPVPEFRAEHPFLYAILDLDSGSILFLGRCIDPGR